MAGIKNLRPAAAAFLLMGSMSLTTTALSFFVGPVCEELGFGRGSFTVYYSLLTAAGTLATPFLGQLVQKLGARPVIAVSAVWVSLGLVGFSVSDALWMFYLAAAFTGLFGTACVTLCASVIVQQSYSGAAASRLTGLVMAGSGAGGVLISAVLPGLISGYGWRIGYRITAICWLILGISAFLLLNEQAAAPQKTEQGSGMTHAEAIRDPRLWLLAVTVFLLSAASGIQQQLPSVLGAEASRKMSFFTGVLAIGKIAQGLLYGRLGPLRGGMIVVLLYACSFFLLPLGGLVWIALGMLAVGMGSVTTLMPIVTRDLFGSREYAAIWGILSAVSNLGALIATPLFGMAFDFLGSYDAAMFAAGIAVAFCLIPLKIALDREVSM